MKCIRIRVPISPGGWNHGMSLIRLFNGKDVKILTDHVTTEGDIQVYQVNHDIGKVVKVNEGFPGNFIIIEIHGDLEDVGEINEPGQYGYQR